MKNTIIAIIVAVVLIIFAFSLGDKKTENPSDITRTNVTTITDNTNTNTTITTDSDTRVKNITEKSDNKIPDNNSIKKGSSQVIEITAKGGYTPRKSIAKAGIPTILRINTNGTFDCSSSVRIPSMNISKYLPPSGVTDIDLGTQQAGILNGSCGMGMYPFEIEFQ